MCVCVFSFSYKESVIPLIYNVFVVNRIRTTIFIGVLMHVQGSKIKISKCSLFFQQGTRKIFSQQLLNATDPDNAPESLFYSILGSGSGSDTGGFVEKLDAPGVAISTFTQAEVDSGFIVYVHKAKTVGNTCLLYTSRCV